MVAVLLQPCIKGKPVMGGGFHGEYDLTFDVGVLFDLFQHEVVIIQTSWLRLAASIPTINIVLTSKQIYRQPSYSYESYPASISAETVVPHPAHK